MWLIGAGPMAVEYSKVLEALDVNYEVVGRGENSAKEFESFTMHPVLTGGLEFILSQKEMHIPETAIVAVGVDMLYSATIELLNNGFKNILVEKPAGLNINEIEDVAKKAQKQNANVFVAYNRRFYTSVQYAKKIILEDGGVTSFNFEFTEWAHTIEPLETASTIKENWLLANSTHVVDLAFFLGGKPKNISTYVAGGLNWHPSGSIYSGAGVSENGALFSYSANWEAPGRWGVEILTNKHRLILSPLEKLQIQMIGSIERNLVKIDDQLDIGYKPGLFSQTSAFISGQYEDLIAIDEQNKMCEFYYSMSKYI